MRGYFSLPILALALGLGVGVAGPVGAIEQPFPVVVEGEALAPQSVPQPKASPTTVSATAAVSGTAVSPTELGLVKGVVVVLSGTTGFARDVAMDQAAKKALPIVLQRLPMDVSTARSITKSVGDAQRFVKSYTLVRESILPQYQLTVDLLFNEALLRKNFGGKILKVAAPVSPTQPVAAVSGTLPGAAPLAAVVSATAAPQVEQHTWHVVVAGGDPATVDSVYAKLAVLDASSVSYVSIRAEEARLALQTPLVMAEVQRIVGADASVEPAPVVAVTPAGALVIPQPVAEAPVVDPAEPAVDPKP